VTNADLYVYSDQNAEVEEFLKQYFFNQPAPVRRFDLKPVGRLRKFTRARGSPSGKPWSNRLAPFKQNSAKGVAPL
jgi:hypothetical protein